METYPLDPEKTYYSTDLLTLDCENGPETRKIGEWLNVDPTIIRIAWAVLACGWGTGIVLYFICSFVLPESSEFRLYGFTKWQDRDSF